MKLAITCTTYNRPDQMRRILKTLDQETRIMGIDARMLIMDDASQKSYNRTLSAAKECRFPVDFQVQDKHRGKEGHWKVVNDIFQQLHSWEFDLALYLQDDIEIDDAFLRRVLTHWEAIASQRKVCMNYIVEDSRRGVQCWTPAPAIERRFQKFEFWQVGWVELHFLANRSFFESLRWSIREIPETRWQNNNLLSSGVGRQISKRLYALRKGMWQTRSSLATHGNFASLMNPEERMINPLKSV